MRTIITAVSLVMLAACNGAGNEPPAVKFDESAAGAGPMHLTGMYTYMADAAVLEECQSGRRFPVLLEADHLAVETAYLAQRSGPGEPLFLSFTGRFVDHAPEPGLAPRPHVIVERFGAFSPGRTCDAGF
jgi:uncharacterized lipoprotein NlpE involved in copper resistance